ncbi:MAG: hypothetical protein KY475_02755 [Planctomycetes bacterium]|nr:hypothetical protein [Planctomycetota bacterium]
MGGRETPCWLTSMVVHLAVMLVIGSIAVPPARVTGFNSWVFAVADEHDPHAEAELVIVQTDEDRQDGGEEGEHQHEPSAEEEVAVTIRAPVEPPPSEPLPPTVSESEENLQEHHPSEEAEESPTPEPPSPIRLASAVTVDHEPQPPADVPPSGGDPPGVLDPNPVYDDVVDRFIEYDVGRLRGAAGERARREFQALGPYAVPALVRGLNRAASIQASCPVVVISSKLEKSLSSTGDYQIIRYAVENIGRGVPENAPHYSRLMSLRKALRRYHTERPELLRQELMSQGIPATDEMVRAFERFSQSTPDVLIAGIHAGDPTERLAAVAATSRLARPLSDGQRSHVAAQLIPRLVDKDAGIRGQAEAGLAALLEIDPELSPDRGGGDASSLWRRRLADFDVERRVERNARSLLLQGMAHERRGRRGPAQEKYRQVLDEFPGAQAAREAAILLRYGG